MSPSRVRLEGVRAAAMERIRSRLVVVAVLFACGFGLLGVRTVELGLFSPVAEPRARPDGVETYAAARADIVDRNGVLLATSLATASLYAEPRRILDPQEAAARLVQVLPELSRAELVDSFRSGRAFVYLKRKLTPRQVWMVNALGIPGLGFEREEERLYPQGRLAAHVVGFTDIDGHGLAGIEHGFDERLASGGKASGPLRLSLDVRVQHALSDELARAVEAHRALGGGGLVLDVATGELLAMASLPDFDPHHRPAATAPELFNRMTAGVYELGSVFKTFTVAMALESGTVRLADGYDATDPIRVGRFLIRDDHPQKRFLTVPEIFVHSSNIGAAKMALDVGAATQRSFLGSLGLLRPAAIELPGAGRPLVPERWGDVHVMTIAYGHGLSVSPLQLSTAIAAMSNGGVLHPATLIADEKSGRDPGTRVISEATSAQMRQLMRLVVKSGTAAQADVPGYRIGGKTGTAEKAMRGGYARTALVSSFVGVFPIEAPRYLVFVMLDEPKASAETRNFRGAGWNAAPTAGRVVLRIAPLLGVESRPEDEGLYHQAALLLAPEGGAP